MLLLALLGCPKPPVTETPEPPSVEDYALEVQRVCQEREAELVALANQTLCTAPEGDPRILSMAAESIQGMYMMTHPVDSETYAAANAPTSPKDLECDQVTTEPSAEDLNVLRALAEAGRDVSDAKAAYEADPATEPAYLDALSSMHMACLGVLP